VVPHPSQQNWKSAQSIKSSVQGRASKQPSPGHRVFQNHGRKSWLGGSGEIAHR
jgi:hypothetical protein